MEDKWFRVTDLDLVMSPIRTLLVSLGTSGSLFPNVCCVAPASFYATREFTETVIENVLEKEEGFTCRSH